jgi:hypothetical protein
MSLLVNFKGKVPFQTIAGHAFCLWHYEITRGKSAATGEFGLGFSKLLNIQDPTQFPTAPELKGTRLEKPTDGSNQFVFASPSNKPPKKLSVHFVAPCAEDSFTPITLVCIDENGDRHSPAFRVGSESRENTTQVTRGPAVACCDQPQGTNGKPAADFAGILPYASELFGVYQPLAGWLGYQNSLRVIDQVSPRKLVNPGRDLFVGAKARLLGHPGMSSLAASLPTADGVLSPVGLINLYREYFFEFDTFLGVPAGHIWISPGGTVEVIEISTRRMLEERTAEQSVDTTRKVEESLTEQADIADAVKEDNANDTKLGASVTAGANYAGIVHADASASFSTENSLKKSSEETHKHTRTQSTKVTSEIRRNFKTTFRTVSEATDTSSRRYVVQNTTDHLVNYELRRKMRKVGVQLQHVSTRLSWQVFLDEPGRDLGLGELAHVVQAPDLSSLKKPEPPPPLERINSEFNGTFILRRYGNTKNDPHQDFNYTRSGPSGTFDPGMHSDNNDDHINANQEYHPIPPKPGYTLTDAIQLVTAKTGGGDAQFLARIQKTGDASFMVEADFLNFGGGRTISFTLSLTWQPPAVNPAQAQYLADLDDYNAHVAELQHVAYSTTVRERINLVSRMRPRPSEDLRSEERQSVYGNLIQQLELFQDVHLGSELIRQIFDVDEMLYFTAPDYWRPRTVTVHPNPKTAGRYPVPEQPDDNVVSWYTKTDKDNAVGPDLSTQDESRVNYLITEGSQQAPRGSSLGWLIQIDGDERRNEFLNAAWVKAVLPIRPGHESEALAWLSAAAVEGEAGLGQTYPYQAGDPLEYKGKTVADVLGLLATQLQASNTDIKNTLATEVVFEKGFDPLDGGFRPAKPYQVFDQWIEVLPTDQIVAVEYDPTAHGA